MRPVEIWSADKCQEHLAAEYFVEPKTNKALCNSQKKKRKGKCVRGGSVEQESSNNKLVCTAAKKNK